MVFWHVNSHCYNGIFYAVLILQEMCVNHLIKFSYNFCFDVPVGVVGLNNSAFPFNNNNYYFLYILIAIANLYICIVICIFVVFGSFGVILDLRASSNW